MKAWELTIYRGGTAILTDDDGETVWASDGDDEFAEEFDDIVTFDEGEEICDWLAGKDYLPADVPCDIVESDETGLHEILDDEEIELEEGE